MGAQSGQPAVWQHKCYFFELLDSLTFDEASRQCWQRYQGHLVSTPTRCAFKHISLRVCMRWEKVLRVLLLVCLRRMEHAAFTALQVELDVAGPTWIGLRKYSGASVYTNFYWVRRNDSLLISNFDPEIRTSTCSGRRCRALFLFSCTFLRELCDARSGNRRRRGVRRDRTEQHPGPLGDVSLHRQVRTAPGGRSARRLDSWNTIAHRLPYVCERLREGWTTPTPPVTTSPVQSQCPAGEVQYDGSCYRVCSSFVCSLLLYEY